MILLIRMKAAAIRAVKTTLNSIMFLLIQKLKNISTGEQTALNSIMFLLILFFRELLLCYCPFFKFHYVSINSRDRW